VRITTGDTSSTATVQEKLEEKIGVYMQEMVLRETE
jgi:hypothetical protein